jgi:hypothetical protein
MHARTVNGRNYEIDWASPVSECAGLNRYVSKPKYFDHRPDIVAVPGNRLKSNDLCMRTSSCKQACSNTQIGADIEENPLVGHQAKKLKERRLCPPPGRDGVKAEDE